jgi:hypothetical protein
LICKKNLFSIEKNFKKIKKKASIVENGRLDISFLMKSQLKFLSKMSLYIELKADFCCFQWLKRYGFDRAYTYFCAAKVQKKEETLMKIN